MKRVKKKKIGWPEKWEGLRKAEEKVKLGIKIHECVIFLGYPPKEVSQRSYD